MTTCTVVINGQEVKPPEYAASRILDPKMREVGIELLKGTLKHAYERVQAGEDCPLGPLPTFGEDPIELAFVRFATNLADDDMIAAVLWPAEYRHAGEAGSAGELDKLRGRVRIHRHRLEHGR